MAILALFPKGEVGQRDVTDVLSHRRTSRLCSSLLGTTCYVSESPQTGWHWGLPSCDLALWSPGKQKRLTPSAYSAAFSIKDTASRNFSALVLGTFDYCDLTACVQLVQLKAQISEVVQVVCVALEADLINEKINHRLLFYIQLMEKPTHWT